MSDGAHGDTARGLLTQDQLHARCALPVEPGSRLVQEQDVGFAHDPLREEHALALSTRQLGEGAGGEFAHADALQGTLGRSTRVGSGRAGAMLPRAHAHHIGCRDGQRVRRGRALYDEREISVATHSASSRHPHPGEDLDQGRLAGAVAARQSDHLAWLHLEVDGM